jgi:hypothetical protein
MGSHRLLNLITFSGISATVRVSFPAKTSIEKRGGTRPKATHAALRGSVPERNRRRDDRRERLPRSTNCPNPVPGRGFVNLETGEARAMPCDKWGCRVCGRAKAYRLGLTAAAAEPERFITLSRAGTTSSQALSRLRTLSQSLRRSGKGWEYLAAVERHRNGFWHLHVLARGSYIPQPELSRRASAAGMGSVVWIERIKGDREKVAAYLVKYLAKEMADLPPRTRRYATSRGFWPGGKAEVERKAFGRGANTSSGERWAVLRGFTP